jgi:hypothetical protein
MDDVGKDFMSRFDLVLFVQDMTKHEGGNGSTVIMVIPMDEKLQAGRE